MQWSSAKRGNVKRAATRELLCRLGRVMCERGFSPRRPPTVEMLCGEGGVKSTKVGFRIVESSTSELLCTGKGKVSKVAQ